ncbi:MAG: hypothetical protein GY723_15180 [bacterium]|nr:hypothetical protein [bacterium]MCP5067438.1 hypothetical protein [bacterium]
MPTVSPDLVEILVCPETKQPVNLATTEQLEKINGGIRDGSLRNRGGGKPENELAEGLVREDEKVFYPVDDGIPVMLIEESIEL